MLDSITLKFTENDDLILPAGGITVFVGPNNSGPDLKVIGIKPFWNVTWVERCLHEGFARCWYAGEWFEPADDGYRDTLLDGFVAFSDHNRNMNSRDFVYWFNGEGMVEFCIERDSQGLGLRAFQRQESEVATPKHRQPRRSYKRADRALRDLFDEDSRSRPSPS